MHPERRFDSLQCSRGIAALGVLLFHSSDAVAVRLEPLPSWLAAIFSKGYLGLDFFFVLSGFIILTSHRHDPRSFDAARTYAVKRLLRIFPPYLPVSIALLVMFWLLPPAMLMTVHGPAPQPSLLSSLLLLPDHAPPVLSVAWTLIMELIFYTVFLTYFVSARFFLLAIALWCVGILARPEVVSPLLVTLFSVRNLEFVMGMGIAWLVTFEQRAAVGLAALVAGLAALVAAAIAVPGDAPIVYGACFAAIVFGLVVLERNGRVRTPAALVTLGDASYSLYLTHNPVQSLVSRIFAKVMPGSTWWLAMAAAIGACLAVALCYHRYFERPAVRGLTAAALRLSPRPRGSCAASPSAKGGGAS